MSRLTNAKISRLMKYPLVKSQQGTVFVTVLFTGLLLSFIGLSIADLAIAQLNRTTQNVYVSNALLTAEAGIEQSVHQLNSTDSFGGISEDDGEFYNDPEQGSGTYETSITAGSSANERIITSIGRAYDKAGNLAKERRVRVTVVGTSSPGYSVQSGPGGLIMNNGYITNSKVYVNGKITMSGSGSVGIGTAAQPLDIFVANNSCPAAGGPTYPSVCSDAAITMPNNGSGRIYGSQVCATGQTQYAWPIGRIPPQMTGLDVGCEAPPIPMPSYDRPAHIASMTTTQSGTAQAYNCSSWWSGGGPTGFARTWPANITLTGNVSWSSSCDLTITGNAYITGNLTIGGSARIRIADSLGTTRPVVIVDGTITTSGGSSSVIPNSSGTGLHLISFRGPASCTPTCTDAQMTGNTLRNHVNTTTVDVGGGNSYPGTIFHSYWGKVRIAGSGNMGSAVGQTIQLDGGSAITFGTDLGTSTDSTWTVRSYQYDY